MAMAGMGRKGVQKGAHPERPPMLGSTPGERSKPAPALEGPVNGPAGEGKPPAAAPASGAVAGTASSSPSG